ncbi:MAG: site-specific DNA-methyltransferase [Prevotella sp.]|nr:site-specific DNA-methyltransferase [Candidatus Prevotella equi]
MESYIKQGDCLELMKEIPDASVDMILADPPYSVLHRNNKHVQWDRIIPFEPLWEQYLRIAKPNAAIVLFCQGMFTAQLMMSQPKLWKYNLIWEKSRATGFLNANRMPMRSHEDIAVFYRSQPTYNPQWRDGESHSTGNGVHKETNQCYGEIKRNKVGQLYDYDKSSIKVVPPTGKSFPHSVLHFKKEHGKEVFHPTQKSVDLLRWLIRTYTNEGEVVLDNTMGSGSTIIAAIREKRKYIGFELNQEYFSKASERIHKEESQISLFD